MFPRSQQRGVSLVELALVLVVVGILLTIAVPAYRSAQTHADGAAIIADFNVIRTAAFDCYSDRGRFPHRADWGAVPGEMDRYLPGEFDFAYKDATYRWWSWSMHPSLAWRLSFAHILIFQVKSPTPELMASVRDLYPGRYVYASPGLVTIVLYI